RLPSGMAASRRCFHATAWKRKRNARQRLRGRLAVHGQDQHAGILQRDVSRFLYGHTQIPRLGLRGPAPAASAERDRLPDRRADSGRAQGFIAQHGLPKGMSSIFYLLTPPGVTICLDGAATRCSDYTRSTKEEEESKFESESYTQSFCSYHSDINPDNVSAGNGNTVLYAAIPWIAGGAGNY